MKKKPSLKSLKTKAWKLFSIYIRSKNADWRGYVACITCSRQYLWNSGMIHAGHFMHDRLDYEEMNINPQCRNCNYKYRKNIPAIYGVKMVQKYGQEAVNDLILRANTHPGYTRLELLEIIEKYKSYAKNNNLL